MYNDVKLEKGMYHLAGKSFLQALEEADPGAQYVNSPLARLDAYERQLKRFGIRVSGADCDRVEKFFTTTESAVLFPEFVRRAVMQGMREAILGEITAVVSRSESNRYQGCELTEAASFKVKKAGDKMPVSKIMECNDTVELEKFGVVVNASYEAVRQQRLDVFALMLRRVGRQLADSVVDKAVTILTDADKSASDPVDKLEYSHLAELYGRFTSFNMKAVLASPKVMADILAMDQMREISSQDVTQIRLPFGAKLINCQQLDSKTILALDTDFALEQIQSSDVVLETDKLIDTQLDCIGISINIGFRTLMTDAVKKLTLSK